MRRCTVDRTGATHCIIIIYDISTFVVIYDNVGGRVLTIRRYGQTDERSSLVTRCGIPRGSPPGPAPAARPRARGSMIAPARQGWG